MAYHPSCPKCQSDRNIRSGIINNRQRYRCKKCGYYFTVNKLGKQIDPYFVVKALQLYIEGVSYREIERLLGINHSTVISWVKKYRIKAPDNLDYRPTYQVMTHPELTAYMNNHNNLTGSGLLITEIGDKFMVIRWERFRSAK
jgi:transposase-like protein